MSLYNVSIRDGGEGQMQLSEQSNKFVNPCALRIWFPILSYNFPSCENKTFNGLATTIFINVVSHLFSGQKIKVQNLRCSSWYIRDAYGFYSLF